jgi:hypothetical protein
LEHRIRDSRIFNIYPFLLLGTPDFDYACFMNDEDITFFEYEADWMMNEKCFLTSCKSHFKNDEIRRQHESTHRKHFIRMETQLAPFWQFIKVNTQT